MLSFLAACDIFLLNEFLFIIGHMCTNVTWELDPSYVSC